MNKNILIKVQHKQKQNINKQLIMIRPSERDEQTSVFHD
jgi:hypothetical protein